MSKRTYNPVQHLLPEIKEPSPNLVNNWSDTADAAPFSEALGKVQDKLNNKNFYAMNPAFDR